jgi:hypothetical protein
MAKPKLSQSDDLLEKTDEPLLKSDKAEPKKATGPSSLIYVILFVLSIMIVLLAYRYSSYSIVTAPYHKDSPKPASPKPSSDGLIKSTVGKIKTIGTPVTIVEPTNDQQRIVAVGDLHGDMKNSVATLRMAGIIDKALNWVGGDTIFVQTGDIVDRGDDTIALYKMFQRLKTEAAEAGGMVW